MSADPSLQEISKTSESTTSCQTEADILSSSSSSSSSCDMTTVEQNCDKTIKSTSASVELSTTNTGTITEVMTYNHEISIEENRLLCVQAQLSPADTSSSSDIGSTSSDSPQNKVTLNVSTCSGDSPLPQSSDPIQEQMSQPSAAITTTITTDDTVSSPDSFNTFQFWRTPLPELNIELDLLSKQSLDQSMLPGISSDSSALIYSLSSSMDHPELGSGTHCVSEQLLSSLAEMELGSMSSDFPPNSQSVSRAEAELRAARIIHTASISTVYNPSETVSDIGSTHVFGHHMNDSTKIIVGGLSECKCFRFVYAIPLSFYYMTVDTSLT